MVKVGDLKDQTGTADRSMLYCVLCGAELSANKGDYFMAKDSTVLKCCGVPMNLVVKRITYKAVNNE